jgi:membrane protein DedA with SNARE-associated domain
MASARGDLWLPGVLAMAMLGMILGSQIGFGLGRWGGRALLRRLLVARVAGVERRYARWGAWLGLIAPFIDGIRQLNGFTAGLLGMTWWRFSVVNALAAPIWAGAWVGGALLIDEHVARLLPMLRSAKPWLFLAVLLGLALLLWRLRSRSVEPAAAPPR